MNKIFANKGVKRNKYPLNNIRYKIDIISLEGVDDKLKKYKFKDLGYLVLYWNKSKDDIWKYHGFITVSELKNKIGDKQYSKFCQGKREFIIQRRINKKNI